MIAPPAVAEIPIKIPPRRPSGGGNCGRISDNRKRRRRTRCPVSTGWPAVNQALLESLRNSKLLAPEAATVEQAFLTIQDPSVERVLSELPGVDPLIVARACDSVRLVARICELGFRVVRQLGSGGAGYVFLVEHAPPR